MLQKEIHQYLECFFTENDCQVQENQPGYLTVQLTVDMDKELMNRPFYWTYIEKTGGVANPMQITFITDPEKAPKDLKGETIHFGAPRLHQLFQTTKKLASYIRLYEEPDIVQQQENIPLHPWLFMNLKISFQCDRLKEVHKSIGLNLIHGQMVEDFHEKTKTSQLKATIPDYCFTITPLIKPSSGILRIENYIRQEIERSEHQWAAEAINRWSKDVQLLDHFYADFEEKPETYQIEKQALQEQYEPIIQIDTINGGIYYLNSTKRF